MNSKLSVETSLFPLNLDTVIDLSKLTSSDFKHISGLLERKEALMEQIQKIDSELASYHTKTRRVSKGVRASTILTASSFAEAVPSISPEAPVSGGRARRGQLKEVILGLLKDAGRDGISIQEISAKAGVKPLNVSAWLAATGKKLGTIEKADRGVYRLKS